MNANVLIIGGGVSGVSVAYHLAKGGIKNIIVAEKEEIAYGSTSQSVAIVEGSETVSSVMTKFQRECYNFFINFSKTDEEFNFYKTGMFFIASTEDQREYLKRLSEKEGEFFEPKEAKNFLPDLSMHNVSGAFYDENCGTGDPVEFTNALFKKAKQLGVEMSSGMEILNIKTENGKVKSAVSNQGEIRAETIINAAGPWAKEVGAMVQMEIPMKSYKLDVFATDPEKRFREYPALFILEPSIWIRSEPRIGELWLGTYAEDPNVKRELTNFYAEKLGTDRKNLEYLAESIPNFLPSFLDAKIASDWAGALHFTPDYNPVIGSTDVEGFFCAIPGLIGFTNAPMVGKLISELIMDKEPSFNPDYFKLGRFDSKAMVTPELFTNRMRYWE